MPGKDFVRWVFYEDEDVLCELETLTTIMPDGFEDDQLFAHGSVWKNTTKSLRKSRKIFEDVKTYARNAGYDRIYSYTSNLRWTKLLDSSLTVIANIECEGEKLEVVEWLLEQHS